MTRFHVDDPNRKRCSGRERVPEKVGYGCTVRNPCCDYGARKGKGCGAKRSFHTRTDPHGLESEGAAERLARIGSRSHGRIVADASRDSELNCDFQTIDHLHSLCFGLESSADDGTLHRAADIFCLRTAMTLRPGETSRI